MPHFAPPRSLFVQRLSTVALAAVLGAAALPAVDATAASGTAPSGKAAQTIPGLHVVKTHFTAVKRRNVSVPKHKSGAADAVTAADGTTASLVPAPPGGPVRSTWTVNYDAGFTAAANGPAAQAAFQAAVDIWSHIVYSPVPIVVNASYANLGGNVLGQAAAYEGYNCSCLGDGTHTYPVPLANALYGADLDPAHPDINAQFNSSPVSPFYYGTDGAPTSGTVDFESVVLHELGHGLGFAGSMSMVSPATTVSYATTPMKWDTFLQSSTGTAMLSYPSGSSQLTTAMESPLYWSGANGISANGATPPTMYAPATWQQGSSGGAHLDESAYPLGNAYSLMTPSIGAQEAVHSPGAVAVAMLHDIGWTAALPTGAPEAPTAVTGTRGDTSATVSWTASTDYGSAITQYVATASPGGATCSTAGTLSCTINGLSNGTSYTFTVKATNANGTSAASAASSAVVPAGKPGTPAAPTALPNNGGATVSWAAPSNNGAAITGYDVQSSADNGQTWSAGLASAVTSTATQATFTGLSGDTSYVFRVAAVNSVGEGAASPASAAITPAQTPAAPTGVQASRGNTQATVSWTAPSNTGGGAITGYRVEWSSDSGTTWSSPLASALTSTATSAAVTGLTNGTSYVFHVAAINSIGTGAYSTQSTATTPAGLPGAPTNVGGTAGDTQVTVTWTAPSSNGDAITGYDVESSTNGTTWSAPVTSALTSTATSAVVSSLTNGQAYSFRVAAINTVGTGAPTATASAITPAATPAAPTTVSAIRGDTKVTLSWTAPSNNGGAAITSYVVRLSTDSGAHWSVLGSTAGSPVSITGLTNGTSYVFSVAAVNGVGTGTFSANSATVMPAGAPSVPTGVSATAADQQATVSWIAPANGGSAITSYDVRYSTNGGTSWTSAGIAYGGSPALLTGLTNGASYLFEVAAINDIGTSSYSAPSAAVMPAAAPDAVTDLTASRDNAKATLSWTEPAANGAPIKSYVVEYTTDNAVHWTTVTGSFTGSPVTVGGLTNGTSYTFAVAAVNAAGTGAFSNVSNAVVPATTPAAPTGVSAVAGDSQVTVSWLVPADDGGVAISSYDVRYSADGGTTWTSSGVVATGSPATVTGLTNGTSYVFDVAALNDVGLGNYSAPSGAAKPWRDSSSLSGGPSTTIAYGNSLVLSTVLRDSTTGSALVSYSVQLMSRTSTSKPWTAYRTVSTSSTGAASATVKPTALTMYSWQFAGTPGHAATTSSAQTVSVAQVVGIAATATSIRHGNVVKYYGTVGPNQAGQYVYLQILVGRTWKTTALKAKLISQRLPNGHTMVGYVLALKTASIGTFSYRAYRPATSVNVLAASKAMALKVT